MPLYGERGRTGGQRSVAPMAGLDRSGGVVLTLTTPEVAALVIAMAAAGEDMPFSEDGRTATARLLDSLADNTRIAVEELRGRIRTAAHPDSEAGVDSNSDPAPDSDIDSDLGTTKPNLRVRRTLEEAVRRGVVVNIEYVDRNGTTTSRSVEAVGFYQGNDGWYLIGWCQLRKGGRIFHTGRVAKARLTRSPIGDRDVDETLGWVPQELTSP